MNAAAPQAPVAPNGKSAKNRKTHAEAHPAALERGPTKGSAFFQELMNARAALKNAGQQLVPHAESAKVRAAEGVKVSTVLAALFQVHKAAAAAAAIMEQDKLDAVRKAAHAKSISSIVDASPVHSHPETPLKDAAGKEKKTDAGELTKAPVVEGKGPATRTEPLIRILDLRRAETGQAAVETTDARRVESSRTSDGDLTAGITPGQGVIRETFAETLPKPVPAPAATAQSPLERLREMAGSELVRATSLVLKDGGGEIRLVLKPESLGSLRIRMNVVDNAIEGRIIVDSSAVKHVIDGSVDALRRAFTAEGFQMGSLQVSVGGQNPDSGERHRHDEAPEVRKIAAQGFERNVPGAENVSLGDLFVNLFV